MFPSSSYLSFSLSSFRVPASVNSQFIFIAFVSWPVWICCWYLLSPTNMKRKHKLVIYGDLNIIFICSLLSTVCEENSYSFSLRASRLKKTLWFIFICLRKKTASDRQNISLLKSYWNWALSTWTICVSS